MPTKNRNNKYPKGGRMLAPKRGRKPTKAKGPFAAWIKSTGKTLADVAKLLGWSHQSVTNVRAGRINPSLKRAVELEQISNGAVPADSWTKLQRGKR